MAPANRASQPAPVDPVAWVQAVRGAWQTGGLRATEPRVRVIQTIARYSAPFSAEELYAELRRQDGRTGRATVYRTLDQLQSAGWLARIHPRGGDAGYAPSFPGHRHHLVCTACGTVITFEGCALDELVAHLASQTAFTIEGHLLQLYGRCAQCKEIRGEQ